MTKYAVLFATSEIAPWVKTGGLGDVASALPAALKRAHQDIRVLVPAYPALRQAFPDAAPLADIPSLAPALPACRLLSADGGGVPFLLLDCPALFDRPGGPYLDEDGRDWPDNAQRFGLLSRIAALLGQPESPLAWRPDVVHVNDWQTGLAPAFLHYQGGAASIVTVHNLAFQGCFLGAEHVAGFGLPEQAWRYDGVEYHDHFCFLKAGLQLATRISTVSPGYASEIQHENFGYGLAPLLRHRSADLRGILNGVDTDIWNPRTDAALAAPYSAAQLAAKRKNKAALQVRLGLEVRDDIPLLGAVSRLTEQKGLDMLLELGHGIANLLPAQLVVLGSGDRGMESSFRALANCFPGHIAVAIGFDETLAHQIEGGADMFVMPSRYEPCGLNQMYSLRYGTPPVVRATGGLADTVVDCNEATLADKTANGFVFQGATPHELWLALERATATWRQPQTWRRLQQNGMRMEFSWSHAAKRYVDLYREAIDARHDGRRSLSSPLQREA